MHCRQVRSGPKVTRCGREGHWTNVQLVGPRGRGGSYCFRGWSGPGRRPAWRGWRRGRRERVFPEHADPVDGGGRRGQRRGRSLEAVQPRAGRQLHYRDRRGRAGWATPENAARRQCRGGRRVRGRRARLGLVADTDPRGGGGGGGRGWDLGARPPRPWGARAARAAGPSCAARCAESRLRHFRGAPASVAARRLSSRIRASTSRFSSLKTGEVVTSRGRGRWGATTRRFLPRRLPVAHEEGHAPRGGARDRAPLADPFRGRLGAPDLPREPGPLGRDAPECRGVLAAPRGVVPGDDNPLPQTPGTTPRRGPRVPLRKSV